MDPFQMTLCLHGFVGLNMPLIPKKRFVHVFSDAPVLVFLGKSPTEVDELRDWEQDQKQRFEAKGEAKRRGKRFVNLRVGELLLWLSHGFCRPSSLLFSFLQFFLRALAGEDVFVSYLIDHDSLKCLAGRSPVKTLNGNYVLKRRS